MLRFFKKIRSLIGATTEREYAEWYLSQSYDHVDLERRMKELDQRGIAMWR